MFYHILSKMRYICLTILFLIGFISSIKSQTETGLVFNDITPNFEALTLDHEPALDSSKLTAQSSKLAAACSIRINSATPSSCSPQTNTYYLAVSVTYSGAPSGALFINGQSFTPAGTNGTETFVMTALPSNGTANISVTAFFANNVACTALLVNAYNAPASCSANACAAPDGTNWVSIANANNPPDGAAYSSVVNGSTIVHNDPNQIGRGSVPYIYYIRDGFVNYQEYLDFLNAADPNNTKSLGTGLITNNLLQNSGGVWSIKPTISNCYQSLTAAQLKTMAIHYVSYNQAARFCNWKATGDINKGAYTFASTTNGNANITNIDYTYTGIRLANEDEYYKATYWDDVNSTWRLYGTSILDANGLPYKSGVTTSGLYTVAYGEVYGSTACDFEEKVARQGGQSLGGIYMNVGGFHDFINPRTATYPLTTLAIRPDNEFATEAGMRSSWYNGGLNSASTFFPSPSFRLVSQVRPCSNCSIAFTSIKVDSATCTNGASNNDAAITLNNISGAAKYSYNTTGKTGLYATNATAFSGANLVIGGLPNPAVSTTYFIRIFSGDTTCFRDTFATVYHTRCFVTPLPTNPCTNAVDRIGGKVFNDYNENGIIDPIEAGQEGIVVNIYNQINALVGSTTTDNYGDWFINNLSFATGNKYRVEFSIPASLSSIGLQKAAKGSGNKSDIQFITAPTCGANFGVNFPINYCESNPQIATPCYINGNPLLSGANMATDNVLISFAFNSNTEFPPMTSLAVANQVGTTWGIAYQRESKYIFTSAFIKRHSGLGPSGISAIYKIDKNTSAVSTLVKLSDIGINVGVDPHNDLPNNKSTPSYDSLTFPLVGKIGMGSITLSDDGKYLFVANLFQKKIHKIFIDNPARTPTSADVTSYNIPLTDSPNGDGFPFALKFYKGKLYVGVTSTAETSQNINDLNGYVYSLDVSTGTFNKVLTIPFNYQRGYPDVQLKNVKSWFPWISSTDSSKYIKGASYTVYPQPLLSAIDFDVDGSMVLDVMDKMGNQLGNNNYWPTKKQQFSTSTVAGGNILRAQPNGSVWLLESNGTSNGISTAGVGSNKGPDGGLYYWDQETIYHQDLTMGSLSILPGSGTSFFSAIDATSITLYSGGFRWLNNLTGAQDHNTLIYNGANTNFGKANGLGGTALLCSTAPIEIGNYVWEDTDGDGVQGANEPPLANITVKLYKMDLGVTSLIATTITASDGTYYFKDYNQLGTGYDTLTPGKMYFVVIEDAKFNTATRTLNANSKNYKLTAQNSSVANANDQNDSDAFLSALGKSFDGYAVDTITIPLGANGYVNHTLDFGFVPCPTAVISSNVPSNLVCVGGNVTFTAVVTNPSNGCNLQWQSSPTGAVWTNIAGATNSTYTSAQNTSLHYRATFVCSGNTCCN